MTRLQRYLYEMLVRVRDFGKVNHDRFSGANPGAAMFEKVAATVAAIDDYLERRILRRLEGRAIQPKTRTAMFKAMQRIAKAGRRVTREDRSLNPFRMPTRRTVTAELNTARVFIAEAAKRQAAFVALGLPPTFISDFTTLVDELQVAADTHISSKTGRGAAQGGIDGTFAAGLELVRDLEVVVETAADDDPALAAAWRAARHIEGQRRRSRSAPVAPPAPLSPAGLVAPVAPVTPVGSDGAPTPSVPDDPPSAPREDDLSKAS